MSRSASPPGPRTFAWMIRIMNLWPPYFGAGVRVRRTATGGYRSRMTLHWWNRNVLGTHFGGSLYAMCDPFFVLILVQRLGPGVQVWDKSATIRFRRPGRGRVEATFEVEPERLEEIRQALVRDGRCEPTFVAEVLDERGEVVATVEKGLWIRTIPTTKTPSANVPTG